jgi:hypothetical protein
MKKHKLYLNENMIKSFLYFILLLELISYGNCLELTGFNNSLIKTFQANSGVKYLKIIF